MQQEPGQWYNVATLTSTQFTCGHCGNNVSSEKGYYTNGNGKMMICHFCNKPTFFSSFGGQVPGPLLGGLIEHLPDTIDKLYKEIRDSTTTNSFTASVLAGRKLLMHIAVELGAEEGKKFVTYVNYLADNGYAPPNSKVWVDEIRQIGNEANHEIVIMTEAQAKSMIKFLEMLLKFNYEFPAEASGADDQPVIG